MIIAGKDCAECIYANIDESDKAKLTTYCAYKNKNYIWGQCIPCDNKTKEIKG